MVGLRDSLGSDSANIGKVIGITIFLLLVASFSWYTANATIESQVTAGFYITLGLVFIAAFAVDFAFVKKLGVKLRGADVPDTMTYEKESPLGFEIPGFGKVMLVIGSLLLAGWIFTSAGAQSTLHLISAPSFQLIDVGPTGSAFLSGAAGVV